MINNNFTYKNVSQELNLIFKDISKDIKNYFFELYNKKLKDSKLNFEDVLYNKFLYSLPENTKVSITSSHNFENETSNSRSSFDYRENQIPLVFYNELYKKINKLYKKLMNIDEKKPIIFATDGTFNNTNSKNKKNYLETSLNMCYYDITNNLPIELNIEGEKNKNNELLLLKKYLKKTNIPKNSIIVLDRAYCSYEFIDFLIKNNFKFIIRFRNNCKNFENIKNINDVRVLKYYEKMINKVPFNKYIEYIKKKNKKALGKHKLINVNDNKIIDIDKIKKFNEAEIIIKYEYTLLTNLDILNFNDDKIKELYKQRWYAQRS